jgi:hypothetical protein
MRKHELREVTRAIPEPIAGGQILPELTQLVISTAGVQEDPNFNFADDIFGVVPVTKKNIRIPTRQGEFMVNVDTARSARAEMAFIDRQYGFTDRTLERFTLAALVDEEEIENADPWAISADAAADARDVVRINRALAKRDLILNTANYGAAGGVFALGPGQGFNLQNGEHLRDVVNEAVNAIMLATGASRDQLKVVILGALGRQACLQDFELLGRKMYTEGIKFPTVQVLKEYLDVGSVSAYSPVYRTSVSDPAPTQMFGGGGSMVILYPGMGATLPRGQMVWGRIFRRGGTGGALPQFYEPKRTSWAFPWQVHEDTEVFNPACGALITGLWQDS